MAFEAITYASLSGLRSFRLGWAHLNPRTATVLSPNDLSNAEEAIKSEIQKKVEELKREIEIQLAQELKKFCTDQIIPMLEKAISEINDLRANGSASEYEQANNQLINEFLAKIINDLPNAEDKTN